MVEIKLPEPDTSSHAYREYKFEKAADFYDVLLNFNDTISKKTDSYYPAVEGEVRWMFRGHWNNTWGIISTAFRSELLEKFLPKPFHPYQNFTEDSGPEVAYLKNMSLINMSKAPIKDQFKHQIMKELTLLQRFMMVASSLGIECNHTPYFHEYSGKIIKGLEENKIEELTEWPNNNILGMMALAQHHGMPTRLLDFTYNPLFAAFFAASYPFENKLAKIPKNKELCVWAFCERIVVPSGLQVLPVYGNRTSNMFAQEGLLILDNKINEGFLKNGRWPYFITQKWDKYCVKFTLPQSEYKRLLCLLWEHNITPARIMPNLDRVTQTVAYRQWLWTE